MKQNAMDRPVNPFRPGGMAFEIMEMALQGQYDGLPGTEDLTVYEIAEVLCISPGSAAHAISMIKRRTGYVVPYIKMTAGRKKLEW